MAKLYRRDRALSTGELHEMQAETDGNPSESGKRLVEIPEDVLDVFKTDGKTDQARCDPGFFQLLRRVGGVGHGGGVLDQAFGIAQGDR